MNHIRLDNVLIPDAKQLLFRTPPHSLAKTLSGEFVYAEVKRPEGKCLVLCVNLDHSDLAFRTAFPIMVANSLGWFSGSTGELQPSLPIGAVTSVTIDDMATTAEDLELLSPDGSTSPVVVTTREDLRTVTPAATNSSPVDASSEITIGPLNEVGVWSVVHSLRDPQTKADSPETVLAEVAVNLASDRETDLRPLKDLTESPHTQLASAGWFSRPAWFYLILLACILTTLEWFLYQRRLIS
ncbi:MAG: hypothetical protein H7Z17_15165 [Fuerstia sp.]|nr:hypothetical protein [Fuerstiella sp.]